MYHPYFRGKQFELITIRESAAVLAKSKFVPIIEPVKEALKGLGRSLEAVSAAQGQAIVIVNPHHGDYSQDGMGISALLREKFIADENISAGILLKKEMSLSDAVRCHEKHKGHRMTFIHAGFTEARAFAEALGVDLLGTRNIFLEDSSGKLYRRHFEGSERILLRDGFSKKRNADYPPLEHFSDLHITYREEGMKGFGDFLMVGDDYTEGGGPAYAVAIHLTFIDSSKDDAMFIYHFVSDRRDTPTDPAGKFAEALRKLIAKIDRGNSKLIETTAIKEFRDLYARGHFPGLGYVKKLSMRHHIETLSAFLT